jgi:drug/metabolite transporter (DMT)-like permease
MAALLALLASIVWGVADFLGGAYSRRIPTVTVLVWSQFAGLVAIAYVLAFGGWRAPGTYLWWGVAGAVCGTAAGACFYRALALGTMSIVAPIAGTGLVVPVVAGLALGERPGGIQLAGILLATAGVVLASGPELRGVGVQRRSILLAVAAAGGFGGALALLPRAGNGRWAMTTATVTAVGLAMTIAYAALARARQSPARDPLPPAADAPVPADAPPPLGADLPSPSPTVPARARPRAPRPKPATRTPRAVPAVDAPRRRAAGISSALPPPAPPPAPAASPPVPSRAGPPPTPAAPVPPRAAAPVSPPDVLPPRVVAPMSSPTAPVPPPVVAPASPAAAPPSPVAAHAGPLTWRPRRRDAIGVAGIGALNISALALYSYASTRGLVAIVAVLASLYSVVTVLLAYALLGERLRGIQLAGVVAAFAGVVCLAAG